MSAVVSVQSDVDFVEKLENYPGKLVVVDFFATWCGPCLMIKPKYKEYASKYNKAVFLEVDVEVCMDSAVSYGVTAMPTFMFFKNGVKIDTMKGAESSALERMIKKWYTADGEGDEAGVRGQIDLQGLIEKNQCEVLNSKSPTVSNVLSSDGSFIESDVDEQLIITISFNQLVKIHSLKLHAPPDMGPRVVKIFINQPKSIDFDAADNMEAVQELKLQASDLSEGSVIPLRFVKFQNVSSITLFIKNNQKGSENTRINYLAFIGNPSQTTNMSDFKRRIKDSIRSAVNSLSLPIRSKKMVKFDAKKKYKEKEGHSDRSDPKSSENKGLKKVRKRIILMKFLIIVLQMLKERGKEKNRLKIKGQPKSLSK